MEHEYIHVSAASQSELLIFFYNAQWEMVQFPPHLIHSNYYISFVRTTCQDLIAQIYVPSLFPLSVYISSRVIDVGRLGLWEVIRQFGWASYNFSWECPSAEDWRKLPPSSCEIIVASWLSLSPPETWNLPPH